jgi:hypothetical protein
MTDSAESPQIGPDTQDAGGKKKPAKQAATAAKQASVEPDNLSFSFETRYPGRTSFDRETPSARRDAAVRDAHDEDDDGPVIRRIGIASRPDLALDTAIGTAAANSTPRLFARQLDDRAFDDSPRVGAAYGTARPPAPAPDEWYDARSDAGYGGYSDNVDFSVAAIRAKRMRRPAGTHKPTSMATKATVFSLASVCLVAAGVSLGLYGQDMKYHIERQVTLASASVQDIWTRLADSSSAALDQANGMQANAGGGSENLTTGSTSPASPAPGKAQTGRKLIYKRLPGAEPPVAAQQDAQPVQPVQAQPITPAQTTAASANADPFSQLLATPSDFATVQAD